MSSLKERILGLLKSYKGSWIPQSHIHRALGVSKSRVSEILAELEKEGLVARRVVGRSKIVYVYPDIGEREVETVGKLIRVGLVFSSEYLFMSAFAKGLEASGYRVEVRVFNDGIKATRALAEGLVDISVSPLVGQLYLYPTYRTYRIILAGLWGGFRVLSLGRPGPIHSSAISTMDYARRVAVARGGLEADETRYYWSSDEVLKIKPGEGYVVTWHPIYLKLVEEGARVVYEPEELDVKFCCTLGVSTAVSNRARRAIARAYFNALETYAREPERGLEYYSSLTGINISTLKSATREYKVAEGLDIKLVRGILREYAPTIPARSIYEEAVETEALG
uniref:MarR family transcriptional regulator n=1 Tax=Thermogladius calderae TaxID=1200300 RepID=A0A7J3XYU3_9CREN